MATFQVAPPETFDFSSPEQWPGWSRRFERFRTASGLVEKEDAMQVSTIVYSMGAQADVLACHTLTEEQRTKDADVKAGLDGYFVKKQNVIFERAKFNQRRQTRDEPVETFITALYSLAEHCEFGALREELIRDRLVVGLRDAKLSEALQMDSDLTLSTAITKSRQSEAVKEQQTVVGNNYPCNLRKQQR